MAKKRHSEHEHSANHERWLLTYADMITLLLVLFIVLYAMSNIDAKKYNAFAENMQSALNGSEDSKSGAHYASSESAAKHTSAKSTLSQQKAADNKFQKVYEIIKDKIKDKGYEDKIIVEKGDSFILIRFKDSVLFFSDSATMRNEGLSILKNINDTLSEINDLIQKIQIEGHTAMIGPDDDNKLFAWELSSGRSFAVLKYMVQKCGLPQQKMTIAGYSHYYPVASNDTEQGRAMNRRVDVKITQIKS